MVKRGNTFYFGLVAAILLLIFHGTPLFAGSATLSWIPPTTNSNGTPLTDLAGYKIYYGTSSGNYPQSINAGNVTTYTVSNLTAGTTYYFAATAYDTSGNESGYSNQVVKTISGTTPGQYTLTLTKSGTGSGTVTSSPTGINCGFTCSASYNSGSTVTLTSAPAPGSIFSGWAGACAGNGAQCTVAINTNTSAMAYFAPQSACANQPVRIARATPRYYSSIQAAYNAAQNGEIIQIQGGMLTGDIDINRNISVTFIGGYDCNFSTYLQETIVNGTITSIDAGTFTLENISLY